MGRLIVRIHDVTRVLSERSVTYAGDVVPQFRQVDAGVYLISELRMSSHSGTHIDAPVHYLKQGDTIDTVPLPNLIGRCQVLDVTGAGSRITAEVLKGRINGTGRLLLKTAFSGKDRFEEDYPCLTLDAAQLITAGGMLCVGIDSLSIESFHCDGSVHRELLLRGCIVIELLDLTGIPEGEYEMVALPLRLAGLDGSPARVVLIEPGE